MNILLDSTDFDEEWAYERLSEYINENSKVTIIPFAFHEEWVKDNKEWHTCYEVDSGKFYEELVNPFLKYGISKSNIVLINYFKDTKEILKTILLDTDIIYFVGGFPEKTVRRINELDMLEIIEAFEGIVMGWSAGASMQSKRYYIAPDKYYSEFSFQEGLGFIDKFAVQVHYDYSDIQNNCIQRFIDNTGLKVYTLEKKSGIIYKDGNVELLGNAREYK